MKAKILVSVVIAVAIFFAVSISTCNCNKPTEESKYQTDVKYWQDSVGRLNDTIMAGKVRQADLEVKYNQESTRADSLAKKTTKTVARYREVRSKTDTLSIIQAADTMSIECELLALQVPVMKSKADSLIKEGKQMQEKLALQSEAYKSLAQTHESEVKFLTEDRDRWKKLAIRRGRKIEW